MNIWICMMLPAAFIAGVAFTIVVQTTLEIRHLQKKG